MKEIYKSNLYKDIDLGNQNSVRKFDSLDLSKELNSESPIIAVQKSNIEIIDGFLESMGIKDNNSISLKEALGRSGFTKIISKELGTIGILATKGVDSTISFSRISDYLLLGTDIGDKVRSKGLNLKKLSTISGETLWKYKTELLLILGLETLERINNNGGNISDSELDILATKFSPTLTKKAINILPGGMKRPLINEVDSNSELDIQILEYLNKNSLVGGVEIVQSGASLIATNNAVIRNDTIIMPSLRNKETGEFEGEILEEIDPKKQIGLISKAIQTTIDVILYENIKNNKPKDFINAIQKEIGKQNN